MKISVVSGILGDYSLDESLAYLSSLGVDEFELGVGGYPGKAHADALVLSKDKAAREKLLDTFKKHNMGISALLIRLFFLSDTPEAYNRFIPILAITAAVTASFPFISVDRFKAGRE